MNVANFGESEGSVGKKLFCLLPNNVFGRRVLEIKSSFFSDSGFGFSQDKGYYSLQSNNWYFQELDGLTRIIGQLKPVYIRYWMVKKKVD